LRVPEELKDPASIVRGRKKKPKIEKNRKRYGKWHKRKEEEKYKAQSKTLQKQIIRQNETNRIKVISYKNQSRLLESL